MNSIRAAATSVILLLVSGTGCVIDSSNGEARIYVQEPLDEDEKEQLIREAQDLLGVPYEWGGDTRAGMDCSGMIQYIYRQMGHGRFLNDGQIVDEIAAYDLYHHNTIARDSLEEIERGDWIFFDEEGEGKINHNAIFDEVDDQGRVWVYDAYSEWSQVVHRFVKDFEDKNPIYGEPLKTVPAE
ncbi:C40 family peptidase [Halorhodospira halochloris]|uniref:C40 family peptidase n=1 Tax=Halorhodospira halochloris TaxID=1052 RepID=UPI001EE7F018|nr:NlpC/P60 family protein [Halorhodospira halochloris]MCG5549189.1 NlpC/P60 family protein [Halorhodospira halochloris]